MGEVLHRLVQTIRLQRDAFVWMDFNDRATGDALVLVVVTRLLLYLGSGGSLLGLVLDLPAILFTLVDAAFFWVVYSGLVYLAVRYLLEGDGGYPFFLRLAGFAYPTTLLVLFTLRVVPAFGGPSGGLLALLLGFGWFLVVVAYGVHYVADLTLGRSAAAVGIGFVGWVVLQSILSGFRVF